MSDFAITVLTSSAVSIALAGLLLWMVRSWIGERLKNAIKSEYNLKLESYKAVLKAEADVSIEKLKSELAMMAYEHQVKFERLHEIRGEVIAEVYAKLHVLWLKVGKYTKALERLDDSHQAERHQAVVEAYNQLLDYYVPKQIYIPEQTTEKINKVMGDIANATNQFHFQVERSPKDNVSDKWMEILEKMSTEIALTLRSLENEFRALVGDESGKQIVSQK